jgi:hypothetical protein
MTSFVASTSSRSIGLPSDDQEIQLLHNLLSFEEHAHHHHGQYNFLMSRAIERLRQELYAHAYSDAEKVLVSLISPFTAEVKERGCSERQSFLCAWCYALQCLACIRIRYRQGSVEKMNVLLHALVTWIHDEHRKEREIDRDRDRKSEHKGSVSVEVIERILNVQQDVLKHVSEIIQGKISRHKTERDGEREKAIDTERDSEIEIDWQSYKDKLASLSLYLEDTSLYLSFASLSVSVQRWIKLIELSVSLLQEMIVMIEKDWHERERVIQDRLHSTG